MEAVKSAVEVFNKLPKSKRGGSQGDAAVTQLASVSRLLGLSSLTDSYRRRLCEILRSRLQPLYRANLSATLDFCTAVINFIHQERVLPLLKNEKISLSRPWESVLASLLSGVLDFMEGSGGTNAYEPVESALCPTICALFFKDPTSQIVLYDENLLSTAYQLLIETLESPDTNVQSIRELIGSRRLGQTIIEIKDFLALEAVLDLLGKLIPSMKKEPAKRTKYLKEVFDPKLFGCSSQVLKCLEVVNPDWSVVSAKIMKILATFDTTSPQLFDVSDFRVESKQLSVTNLFVIDKDAFTGNLDQNNQIETLKIPFSCVDNSIDASVIDSTHTAITMKIKQPPLLGRADMDLPPQEYYMINFKVKKDKMKAFEMAIKHRKLTLKYPAVTSKLSKAPSELLEDTSEHETLTWAAKADVLTQMASPPQFDHLSNGISNSGHGSSASPEIDDLPEDELPMKDTGVAQERDESNKASHTNRKPSRPRRKTVVASDEDEEDDKSPSIQKTPPEAEAPKKTTKTTYATKGRQVAAAAKNKADKLEGLPEVSKTKKRAFSETDVEDEDHIPVKRQRQRETGAASLAKTAPITKGRHLSISNPVVLEIFDQVPEPENAPPKPRARAMKGKNGKAPTTAKPAPVKKKKPVAISLDEASFHPAIFEAGEPAIEEPPRRKLRSTTVRATGKPKPVPKPVSKKVKKAPWEETDFIKKKAEFSDPVVPEDPISDNSTDPVASIDLDISHTVVAQETPFGDKYTDLSEPTKGLNTTSSVVQSSPPPARPTIKKEALTIDLPTSSPSLVTEADKTCSKPVPKIPEHTVVAPPEVKSRPPTKPLASIEKASREKSLPQVTHRDGVPVKADRRTSNQPNFAYDQWEEPGLRHEGKTDKSHTSMKSRPAKAASSCYNGRRASFNTDKPGRRLERLPSPPPPAPEVEVEEAAEDAGYRKAGRLPSPPIQTRWKREAETPAPRTGFTPDVNEQRSDGSRNKSSNDREFRTFKEPDAHYERKDEFNRRRDKHRRPEARPVLQEEDPMDKIAAILGEITDVMLRRTEDKFTAVPKELRLSENHARQRFVTGMDEVNNQLVRHYNNMFDLDAEYNKISADLLSGLQKCAKANQEKALACRKVIKEFDRNSLCNKFTADLVPNFPGMAFLKDPSIGFPSF